MKKKYAIIAGTNKAATTSFFEYLAEHPSMCAAFIKQTFFFLDKQMQKDLQVVSLYDYEKGNDQYDLFFRDHTEGQIKLEASPEYLYGTATAQRIADFFSTHGDGEIIFILREPVSRFVSLFYFGKQQGVVSRDCSFHDFMQQSIQYTANTNTSLMAYSTGFYSTYLENYKRVFGKDKIKIYFYEDMVKDTRSFMHKVANDLDIDASFYNDFVFETHNPTKAVVKVRALSSAYKRARQFMMERSFKTKMGYNTAMLLKKTITPLYRKINLGNLEKEKIEASDLAVLQDAYKAEKQNIQSLFEINVPW